MKFLRFSIPFICIVQLSACDFSLNPQSTADRPDASSAQPIDKAAPTPPIEEGGNVDGSKSGGEGAQKPQINPQSEQKNPYPLPISMLEAQSKNKYRLPYSGLAFSAIGPYYMSSNLYYLDFAKDQVTTLATGESGDPVLFWQNDGLWLFNRSFNNSNYRVFYPPTFANDAAAQMHSPAFQSNDPHDVVSLNSEHLLLANYNEGSLNIMNQKDGTLVFSVTSIPGYPAGSFHPEMLFKIQLNGVPHVLVVHQGLDMGTYRADGSQQVFLFKVGENRLDVVDLVPGTADKIDGIGTTASLPSMLQSTANGEGFYIGGLCDRSIHQRSAKQGPHCTSAIDYVSLKDFTVGQTWKMDGLGFYMNDHRSFFDLSSNSFYANVIDDKDQKGIVKIELLADAVHATTIHVFNADDSYPTIWFEPIANVFFIGEQKFSQPGKLTLFDLKTGVKSEYGVDFMPYSYALIP